MAGKQFDFEEQIQLRETEASLVAQHNEYLKQHPEVKNIMSDFLADCLLNKPDNIYASASNFFSSFAAKDAPQFTPTIITGPSGVGKGTLIERLMREHPDAFGLSVSHTTRAPRAGEIPGYHYHFSSVAEMRPSVERGEFIEHANVHDNLYGTSRKAVENVVKLGKICILDIDVQGCESVKKSGLHCRYIFIAPPSEEELKRRLIGRGTETPERIEKRLLNAKTELQYMDKEGFFDVVIVNDDFEEAYAKLKSIVADDIERRNEYLFASGKK